LSAYSIPILYGKKQEDGQTLVFQGLVHLLVLKNCPYSIITLAKQIHMQQEFVGLTLFFFTLFKPNIGLVLQLKKG